MELPRRDRGDELLKPGEYLALRARLRRQAAAQDLTTVVACAFDHRTRVLPFIGADLRMAPAGARSIGAAMADAGFSKTRIVLQQWNRNFRPSRMRIEERVPDLFLVSSMALHSARARELAADAARIQGPDRPLKVVGGSWTVYQPWEAFRCSPGEPEGFDVAITGEEYVWMSLLEVLLSERATGEPLREAFLRARDRGHLDGIPGLMYARTDERGVAHEVVDTGTQRLLGDLDELPHPALSYRLLEPPSRRETLGPRALPPDQVKRHSPISSLVLTFGCKFRCPYCPIPAYNQKQHRLKSPGRIVDEMATLHREYGLRYFFGTDDNFFNDHRRTLEITDALARARKAGVLPRRPPFRWATEATVHDTLQLKDHLGAVRQGNLRAVWMGVEDLTATFVKKGQSVDKTTEAFRLLLSHGIHPMPMMMHHDGQPLYTPGRPYGLLNQARILRKAGAVSFQVLMMTPATGSKLYEDAFTKGLAFKSAGGREIEPYMTDANYVIASGEARPWKKQLNLLLAYMYFYNPLRFFKALFFPRSRLYFGDSLGQLHGMWGSLHTIRRTVPWMLRLLTGRIERLTEPPASRVPVVRVGGCAAQAAAPKAKVG
jgi:radical SAM superfamily enzyme YgiQ (UPF0313 family)